MANHKSAKKRIRQTERKNERNRSYISKVRTAVKGFQASIETSEGVNIEEATKRFSLAQSLLNKASTKGILHANSASRRVSRLSAQLAKATKKV